MTKIYIRKILSSQEDFLLKNFVCGFVVFLFIFLLSSFIAITGFITTFWITALQFALAGYIIASITHVCTTLLYQNSSIAVAYSCISTILGIFFGPLTSLYIQEAIIEIFNLPRVYDRNGSLIIAFPSRYDWIGAMLLPTTIFIATAIFAILPFCITFIRKLIHLRR